MLNYNKFLMIMVLLLCLISFSISFVSATDLDCSNQDLNIETNIINNTNYSVSRNIENETLYENKIYLTAFSLDEKGNNTTNIDPTFFESQELIAYKNLIDSDETLLSVDASVEVTTWDALKSAISGNADTIYITRNLTATSIITISRSVIIIGKNNAVINCSDSHNKGMFALSSSTGINFTLINVTCRNNHKNENGGVLLAQTENSIMNFINCCFIDNTVYSQDKIGGVFRFQASSGKESFTNKILIDNCLFEGNSDVLNHGGAICCYDSYLTIKNTKFINNTAPKSGAVHMHVPGLLIDNCTFIGNSATGDGKYGFGAAVSCLMDAYTPTESYNYTIKNCYFEGNTASLYGAAIEIKANYVTVDNCTFLNNTAPRGAAICIEGDYTTVINSKIYNNTDTDYTDGGAIYIKGNNATIINNIFENNISPKAAAIYIQGNNAYFEDILLNNNEATSTDGGAVYVNGNYAKFVNITANNNIAKGLGGAIYVASNNANFSYISCSNNSARNGGAIYIKGDRSSFRYIEVSSNNATFGGAIYVEGDDAIFYSTLAKDNTAVDGGVIYITGTGSLFTYFEGTNNKVTNNGGVIYVDGTSVTFYNVSLCNNSAGVSGGAIYVASKFVNFTNVTINDNYATNGGGIFVQIDGANARFENVVANRNKVSGDGGAIFVEGNYARFYSVIANNNTAVDGGVVYVKCSGSEFLGFEGSCNNATSDGGAIYVKGDNVIFDNIVLTYCNGYEGGAIYVNSTKLSTGVNFTNTKLYNNSAIYGGAIYIRGHNVLFEDMELCFNKAYYGGSTYIEGNHTTLKNTIFLNNTAIASGDNIEDGLGGAVLIIGYNEVLNNTLFKYNKARNGSALYFFGSSILENVTFIGNQAWVYHLGIDILPKPQYIWSFTNLTKISIQIIGGNNIANAIYNAAYNQPGTYAENILFYNVTYGVYINGTETTHTTGVDERKAIIGAENSKNGTIIYQDDRENNQIIDIQCINPLGEVILKEQANHTDIFGNIVYEIPGILMPGYYFVNTTHLEDNYYLFIRNTTWIDIIPITDLTVNTTGRLLGDIVEWTVVVTNFGPHNDSSVYVDESAFKGKIIGTPIVSRDDTYFNITNKIWNIGILHVNEVLTLKFNATYEDLSTGLFDPNALVNNVNITGHGNDTNLSSNYYREGLAFSIEKSVNNTTPFNGEDVKYTIVIKNEGNGTAINIKASDKLPEGFILDLNSLDDGTGRYTVSYNSTSRIITWIINSLDIYETITLNYIITVNCTGNKTNEANVGAFVTKNTISIIDFSVSKNVSNIKPKYGDNITYDITVKFDIPIEYTLYNITVYDIIPTGLVVDETTLINTTNINVYYNKLNNTIIWTIKELSTGELVVLPYNVTVLGYGSFTNIVTSINDMDLVSIYVPGINITKTVSNLSPDYGDDITYTIHLVNDDIVAMNNIHVTDIVPVGLDVDVDSISHGGVYNKTISVISWIINITAGEHINLTYNVTVKGYGNITNTVSVFNRKANSTIDVPEIIVNKTTSVEHPNYDDEVEFTVNVKNIGDRDVYDVIINDILPEGLDLNISSLSPNAVYNNKTRTITWTLNITSGNFMALTYKVAIKSYGNLTNIVTVNDHSANVTINVPEINVNKSTPIKNPNYNEIIEYSIIVKNIGDVDCVNVTVCDSLPEGLEVINGSITHGGKLLNEVITWNLNITQGNTVTLTYRVIVKAYGNLTNLVTVGNHTSNVTIEVPDVIIVNKTTPVDNPNYGDVIEYSINVKNSGNRVANNVTAIDYLPVGLEVDVDSISNEGIYNPVTRTIIWSLNLIGNESLSLTYNATVKGYGTIFNKVVVGNHSYNKTIYIPDVIILNKTSSIVNPNYGDVISYNITIKNNVTEGADNFIVVDYIPRGLDVDVYTITDKGVYNPINRTITWKLSLNAGESLSLIYNVTVKAYGNLTNLVTVGNHTTNNTIRVPEIIVNKTTPVDNPNYGDEIEYTIIVKNIGDVDCVNVTVCDSLPEGLEVINGSITHGGKLLNEVITWNLNITQGNTVTLTYRVIVKAYGNLTNLVTVGNHTTNNSIRVPVITVFKEADDKIYFVGDEVEYIIKIVNNNDFNASNVVIIDRLPQSLTNITTEGYDPLTHTIKWVLNVTANSYVNLTVKGVLDNTGIINNTVVVGNYSDYKVVNVTDFNLTKKATNTSALYIGDIVVYNITITNIGDFDIVNLTVTDLLPQGLLFISASHNGTLVDENVLWYIDVAAHNSLTLNVVALITKAGLLNNTVVAHNKNASTSIVVDDDDVCDIDVVMDVPEKVKEGDVFDVVITVINHGPSIARNVTLFDIISGSYDVLGYNITKGYGNSSDMFFIGDLAANETSIITITLKATSKGVIDIFAKVTTITHETSYDHNNCTASIIVESNYNPEPEPEPVNPSDIGMRATGNPLWLLCLVFLSIVALRRKSNK